MAALAVDSSIAEHLIGVVLGTDAHVLLTKSLDMGIDVGSAKLLSERHLLERELVDRSAGGAKQHSGREESTLHDGDGSTIALDR